MCVVYNEVMKKPFEQTLIEGKIVELVFEQMLREAKCFTVLAFGYESTLPELMQKQADMRNAKQTMDVIRRAPDFVVINNETHDVHLIEVKYRSKLHTSELMTTAMAMAEAWKPAYLFVATPDGFFFGKATEIVQNKGKIAPLHHKDISPKLQAKYLTLLKKFIV